MALLPGLGKESLAGRTEGNQQSSSSQQQPTFPFLKLPVDIRVIIYSYVVSWPTFTKLPHSAGCEVKRKRTLIWDKIPHCREIAMWPPVRTSLPIFQVCRQVKDEALEELLRTPLVFEEAPPYVIQKDRTYSKAQFLTSNISTPLLCRVRRMVLCINPSLELEQEPAVRPWSMWFPWDVFLPYLWHIWWKDQPKLEHLTIRLGDVSLDSELLDWALNMDMEMEEFRTKAPSGFRKSGRSLFALAGVLRMLSDTCEVDLDGADANVVRYLKEKTWEEERPAARCVWPYRQLDDNPEDQSNFHPLPFV